MDRQENKRRRVLQIWEWRQENKRRCVFQKNLSRIPKELLNLRHASLRNAIERAFGVLKKRFPIIASSNEPSYGVETQKKIIIII